MRACIERDGTAAQDLRMLMHAVMLSINITVLSLLFVLAHPHMLVLYTWEPCLHRPAIQLMGADPQPAPVHAGIVQVPPRPTPLPAAHTATT
jgi:hypothetical protein